MRYADLEASTSHADRKSTRLNSSHTEIYTLSLHDALPISLKLATGAGKTTVMAMIIAWQTINAVRRPGSKHFTRRSEEHTSELQSHRDLHSFPTRRSSDLAEARHRRGQDDGDGDDHRLADDQCGTPTWKQALHT